MLLIPLLIWNLIFDLFFFRPGPDERRLELDPLSTDNEDDYEDVPLMGIN